MCTKLKDKDKLNLVFKGMGWERVRDGKVEGGF